MIVRIKTQHPARRIGRVQDNQCVRVALTRSSASRHAAVVVCQFPPSSRPSVSADTSAGVQSPDHVTISTAASCGWLSRNCRDCRRRRPSGDRGGRGTGGCWRSRCRRRDSRNGTIVARPCLARECSECSGRPISSRLSNRHLRRRLRRFAASTASTSQATTVVARQFPVTCTCDPDPSPHAIPEAGWERRLARRYRCAGGRCRGGRASRRTVAATSMVYVSRVLAWRELRAIASAGSRHAVGGVDARRACDRIQ